MSGAATAGPGRTLELGPAHPAVLGRSGRGITVAVIDSGVNPWHPHIGGLAHSIAFADDGSTHDDAIDRLGHGTAVAAAIHEKAPDAELHILKVFDRTLSSTVQALVSAIDAATERGARLVNLSLGTVKPQHARRLGAALDRARERGTILVSAREHDGTPWYPGSLPGAVGVELDRSCPRDVVRLDDTSAGAPRFRASGYPRPIPGVPPERNLNGISFAVANVTGMLARLLEGRPAAGPEELAELLR